MTVMILHVHAETRASTKKQIMQGAYVKQEDVQPRLLRAWELQPARAHDGRNPEFFACMSEISVQ